MSIQKVQTLLLTNLYDINLLNCFANFPVFKAFPPTKLF